MASEADVKLWTWGPVTTYPPQKRPGETPQAPELPKHPGPVAGRNLDLDLDQLLEDCISDGPSLGSAAGVSGTAGVYQAQVCLACRGVTGYIQ
jgi:hypothetical protein